VVGDDDDDYEIPQDYEDVDSGQTYANDVVVGAASHLVAQTEQGYAVMASKPSSSPQVFTARARRIARYALWPGVCPSVTSRSFLETDAGADLQYTVYHRS